MKKFWFAVLILLFVLPVAGIGTFLLISFWRWLEATTALESIGHSGPATWCFGVVYALLVTPGFGTCLFAHRRALRQR